MYLAFVTLRLPVISLLTRSHDHVALARLMLSIVSQRSLSSEIVQFLFANATAFPEISSLTRSDDGVALVCLILVNFTQPLLSLLLVVHDVTCTQREKSRNTPTHQHGNTSTCLLEREIRLRRRGMRGRRVHGAKGVMLGKDESRRDRRGEEGEEEDVKQRKQLRWERRVKEVVGVCGDGVRERHGDEVMKGSKEAAVLR